MSSNWFAADYSTAREWFQDKARRAGARLSQLPISPFGPRGESLSIDIAWLGSDQPSHVLLHLCGVHGVEGFVGSAIQLSLMDDTPRMSDNHAIVLVHAVNPYGMVWLRRANVNNVDLNRNVLLSGEEYCGAPEGYARLNSLLNPTSPPSRFDSFYLQSSLAILRHGFRSLKQAVACGQYEFPKGIFFGGEKLETGPQLLLNWIREHLPFAERVVSIDIHSGLGKFGEATLLVPYERNSEKYLQSVETFGGSVQSLDTSGVAYKIRGSLMGGLPGTLPRAKWTCIGQEFGTYHPLRVLKALRDENRLHHYGEHVSADHPIKRNLLNTFCPKNDVWRESILAKGEKLIHRSLELLVT